MFNFSSEATEQNWRNFYKTQVFNVLYQVCVIRTVIQQKKIAPWPLIDWCICKLAAAVGRIWTKLVREAKKKKHYGNWHFLFSGRSVNKAGRLASDWLLTSLQPLNVECILWRNSTGSKCSSHLLRLCFPDRSFNKYGRPGFWLADTSTAERILTKLDGKQVLNILFHMILKHVGRGEDFVSFRSRNCYWYSGVPY